MSYIAFVDSSHVVTRVVKAPDDGQDWARLWSARFACICVETSRDVESHGQFALPGFTYDEGLGAFLPPKPYNSWVLDEATFSWVAPTPEPQDGKFYEWNEATEAWLEIDNFGEFFDVQ